MIFSRHETVICTKERPLNLSSRTSPECQCGSKTKFRQLMPAVWAAATLVAFVGISAVPLRAGDIDGVYFPDTLRVDNHDLALSGCGLREVLWTDVYSVGLYCPIRCTVRKLFLIKGRPRPYA